MPRPRNPENVGLPDRWRFNHGAYFYQVPPGLEPFWGFKRMFRLGATYDQALATFQEVGGRLQPADDSLLKNRMLTAAQVVDLPGVPRSGVYFLLRGETVVYVGRSASILARINTHYSGPMEFDGVRFVAAEGLEMDRLEQLYIARFAPEYNIKHVVE